MCGQIFMPTEKLGEKEATVSISIYKHDNNVENENRFFQS